MAASRTTKKTTAKKATAKKVTVKKASAKAATTAGQVVIRKYANRRLYDTSTSSYVNLDHIATLIRDGVELKVVDVEGADITRQVLTQIIVEGSRDTEGPPLEFLRDLVRAGDKAQRDFLQWYLSSAAQVYQRIRSGWESAYRKTPAGMLSERLAKSWDPAATAAAVRGLMPFLSGLDPESRSSKRTPSGPVRSTEKPDTAKQLEELRRQLEALEARIES